MLAGGAANVKSVLKTGACVSCGRWSGRRYRECPYCGERVWQPLWHCAGLWAVRGVPPAAAALLVLLARPDFPAFARAWRAAPAVPGLLLASGVGLLLLPPPDDEAVVSSRRELALWRAEALLGGGLLAASAAASAIAMTFPNESVPARWALALPVALCACAAPCFCRVPWSSIVAVGLVALALAGL